MTYYEKDNFTDVSEILATNNENSGNADISEGQVQNSNGDIITLGNPDRITKEA